MLTVTVVPATEAAAVALYNSIVKVPDGAPDLEANLIPNASIVMAPGVKEELPTNDMVEAVLFVSLSRKEVESATSQVEADVKFPEMEETRVAIKKSL
jgi:hypothetical protein